MSICNSASTAFESTKNRLATYWTVPVRQPVMERGSLSPSSSSSYSDSDEDVQVIAEIRAPVQPTRARHARRMRVESSSSDSDDEEIAPVRREAPAKRITITQSPKNEDSETDDEEGFATPTKPTLDIGLEMLDPSVEVSILELPQLSFPNIRDDSVDLDTKTPLPTSDLSGAAPVRLMKKPVHVKVPRKNKKTPKRRPEVSLKRRTTSEVIAELVVKKRKL